ncbi:MAG: alpha/beta hydrolase [Lachnospiraceae bacterium]
MKAKNKILTLMILSAGAAATTAAINKFIQVSATSKNLLSEPQSLCYRWRLGNIHYTKTGSGKPILLIHDLKTISSGYEWSSLISRLKENYTVYTIDLLGCGRSEKPNIIYTNYLYVQLISDFIKSEIGHRTSIIASNESASVPIMACANNPELFDQLMLINPLSLLDYSQIPGKTAKSYKFLLDMPVLGTMLYNIAASKKEIKEYFTKEAFYNPYSVKANYIDSYYESAHLGSNPKAVYASIQCNYTKCNIVNALKKINNSIYLIGGKAIPDINERLDEYKYYNPSIECLLVPDAKQLPQLETPTELYQIIKTYFG